MKQVKFKHDGVWHRLTIDHDADPMHPRQCHDTQTTLITWHPRYCFGGVGDSDNREVPPPKGLDALAKEYKLMYWWPVYLFDHSGLSVSMSPFTCQWDSGQVGIIGFTDDAVKEILEGQERPNLKQTANGEIQDLDHYLKGLFYQWELQQWSNITGGYEYIEGSSGISADTEDEALEEILTSYIDNDMVKVINKVLEGGTK